MNKLDYIGIDELFWPMKKKEFLARYWPDQPVLIKGGRQDVLEGLGLRSIITFPTLAPHWAGSALLLPNNNGDESQGEEVTVSTALEHYKRGYPLFLGRADLQFPKIAECINNLRHELGIPAAGKFVAAFHASPGSTTTARHFDHSSSFVIQLSGTRTWTLSENYEYPNPTNRYSTVMPRVTDELNDYKKNNTDIAKNNTQLSYKLNTGDILFVPNGWWHTVQSHTESLALMLIAINYTWADVVVSAIREKLLQRSEWRAFAIGAKQHNKTFRSQAEPVAKTFLQNLPNIVSTLTVNEILRPRYCRTDGAAAYLNGNKLIVESNSATAELALSSSQAKAFQKINYMNGSFTEADLSENDNVSDEIIELVNLLSLLNFIKPM